MSKLKTYDPKKVIITFGGVPITGFADGTFVKVSPTGDLFSRKVGADGEVARARSNDDTHSIEITLMQTAQSNAYMSSLIVLDRLSNSGVRPLSITDLSGATIGFWPEAWIKRDPDVEDSKEIGERMYAIETGQVLTMLNNGQSS